MSHQKTAFVSGNYHATKILTYNYTYLKDKSFYVLSHKKILFIVVVNFIQMSYFLFVRDECCPEAVARCFPVNFEHLLYRRPPVAAYDCSKFVFM